MKTRNPLQRGVENRQLGMRKPRSWLTPLGRFWVHFALFLAFLFAMFSRRPVELDFTAFGTVLRTFREAFAEVFGDGWK